MQFFAIIPAILAVAASAAPTARGETTNLVADVMAHAESAVTQLEAAGCDKLSEILFRSPSYNSRDIMTNISTECISWLASDTAACAAAAAEGGLSKIP